MDTDTPRAAISISRRTTLQMVLATIMGSRMGKPKSLTAQDPATGTWNWGGNAGHTGELPGPGLDVMGALGELWRIPNTPRELFGIDAPILGSSNIVGFADGAVFFGAGDGIWARRMSDGAFLWGQSAQLLAAEMSRKLAATPTPVDSAPGESGTLQFAGGVAIDNGLLLIGASNGHLLALDSNSGALRWDFDVRSAVMGPPTVVDHVAYIAGSSGMCAVELGEQPRLRWQTEVGEQLLGVTDGLVVAYVPVDAGASEIRALTVADGLEYWRVSLDDVGDVSEVCGINQSGIVLICHNSEWETDRLVMIGLDGEVAWNISHDDFNSSYGWVLNDTVTRLTATQSEYDYCRFQALYTATGTPSWDLELNASQWPYALSGEPLLCDGKAYALVHDGYQDMNVLIVADPQTGDIHGAWDSRAIPLLIADGLMLAEDYNTGEIFAIGPVPAVLQAGGRASLARDATLRGAPRDTAIERAQLTAGTLVDVTGNNESTDGVEWVPVTVQETGESGWLPVDVLSGQDGPITFTSFDVFAFGVYTSYPQFTPGAKAEIVESVDLLGAPSASSARKTTLEVGTLVTITAAPTQQADVEWCPVLVDTTKQSGWVPTSALKVVPIA